MNNSKLRVLITLPDLNMTGGVVGLFNILRLNTTFEGVDYFIIHNRMPKMLRLIYKYFKFAVIIRKYDVIHINPSLNIKSFLRDSVFSLLTILFEKKLLVYWHGWDNSFEEKLHKNIYFKYILRITFLKAQTTIVLGQLFKEKLELLGYKNTIYIETNTAEDNYIENIKSKTIESNKPIRLLFLSRLEIEKGVYIAIDTLKLLNKDGVKYTLTIAGSGTEEENIRSIISNINAIEYLGNISGKNKHEVLVNSDIMFFPTFYPEGLPLTLLEALMYGMPIITRPVGGIPDIITNKNGFITDSLDPKEFVEIINNLCSDTKYFNEMSINNLAYSSNFKPAIVRNRIYKYYSELVL